MNLIKKILLCAVSASLSLASASSFAVDAGALMKQENDLQNSLSLPNSIPANLLDLQRPEQQQGNGLTIQVKRFVLKGEIALVPEEKLQDLVADLLGKPLSFQQIQSAAERINRYYNEQGYFLAQAIIPKQEVVDGTVVIFITEGKLDQEEPIKINPSKLRLNENTVKKYINNALSRNLKQSSLERGILNLNDNPGISASASLEPGKAPGTTRIVLDVTEGPLFEGSVVADNFGSRYTGSDRFSTNLSLNNPLGYGDSLNFSWVTAVEQTFDMLKVGYGFPIGRSGLRANVAYTDLFFKLGKTLRPLNGLGHSRNWSYGLSYPIYRSAETALIMTAGYDWKASYNEMLGAGTSDKRTNVFNGGLTLSHVDKLLGGGFTQAQLAHVAGDLDLSRNATNYDADQGDGGARTNGSYQKSSFQLVRIQRGTERLSFQGLLAGQYAQTNLDGGEKFMLGGPTGVRAYPAGEASGDHGYRFSVDAKYALATGTRIGDIVLSTFYDYGKIWQYENTSLINGLTNNSYDLAGWGLGLDVVASGKYTLKAGWAKAIGSNPGQSADGNNSDGLSHQSRFWLMGNVSF
jgi:hemolysin activation/secretion protein